jgi:hypothetical protein
MRQIVRFLRLRWGEKKLLIHALLLITAIRLGLRFVPFAKLSHWVDRIGQRRSRTSRYYTVNGVAWAVTWAAKLTPGGAKCLAKAWTTQILLYQQGYPADFKIGVAKAAAGHLEAHAWIEIEGQVIMGWLPDLTRYKSLGEGFQRHLGSLV